MADQQEKRRLQEELGLPGDKIDEYIAAFEMFDRENRGKLTPDMLKRVLNEEFGTCFMCVCVYIYKKTNLTGGNYVILFHSMLYAGQTFSREDIDYMLKQFSEDGDVTFEKFARSLKEKMANPAYDEAFADAFDLLDTDKQGILTKEKLIAGMQKLGENLTDEEADEMLKVASNKDDFVKIMKHGGGMDSIQNASQQNNATAVAASGGGNTASSTATTSKYKLCV